MTTPTFIVELLDAPAAAAPLGGFRNRLINGAFDFWQRRLSATSPGYVADRWKCDRATGVAATFLGIDAPAGFPGRFAMRMSAVDMAAESWLALRQRIEARMIADLDTTACVASFHLQASTSVGGLVGALRLATNAVADAGVFGNVSALVPFAIPAGVGRVSVPLSAAQTAGLKYGAELSLLFYQAGGEGSPTIDVGGVQFEPDATGARGPTEFEFRPEHIELALCDRYFQKSAPLLTPPGAAPGAASLPLNFHHASGYMMTTIALRRMRAAPTVTVFDGAGAPGRVSYYDTEWRNGSLATYIAPFNAGFTLNHTQSGASWTAFEYAADAEL